MIPLPLLHDNPPAVVPAPATPAGALNQATAVSRWAAPPWDREHFLWLFLDAELPEEHLARLIVAVVAQLDLQPLYHSYAGRGSLPCDPKLLLQLVLFEYAQGRASPEQWFQDVQDSLPVRWLLFGLQPARSTLYAFRDRVAPVIDGWNRQILAAAFAEGYTTGRRAALDGSYLRAHASRHHLLGESGLRRRCQLLEEALAEDQAALGRSSRPLDPWLCWWTLVLVALLATPEPIAVAPVAEQPSPGQLSKLLLPPRLWPAWMARTPGGRQEQLRGLRRALRRWRVKNQRQQAKFPCRRKNKRGQGEKKVSVCVSEPEAALGRDKHKVFRPLYNVQLLRDLDSEFLLSYGTFQATSDSGLLPVMLQRCQRLTGRLPAEVVADHSYATALDLAYCQEQHVILYAPLDPQTRPPAKLDQKDGQLDAPLDPQTQPPAKPDQKYGKKAFRYEATRDVYVCPAGQELWPGGPRRESRVGGQEVQTVSYQARKSVCAACAQRSRCTASKQGRIIKRSEHEALLEGARERLASAAGKSTYRLRKETVELSIARLKRLLGGDVPLSSYGKPRARTQVGLVVLLLNALALFKARQRAGRLPPPPRGGDGDE